MQMMRNRKEKRGIIQRRRLRKREHRVYEGHRDNGGGHKTQKAEIGCVMGGYQIGMGRSGMYGERGDALPRSE